MRTTLLLCAALLLSVPAWAVFSLRVGNPRVSASTQQGTLEQATLSVRPVGLYLEYGLYLTFSARGTTYKSSDSLEITFRFELPANAIVHDSWLWINNDISRAIILDRWTASNIYEEIVRRNQDPSVLFKNSAIDYELRVFPMRGDEVRKVKITYLMPIEWGREEVEARLPIEMLKTSRFQLPAFNLLVRTDNDWKNPRLPDFPSVVFEPKSAPKLGAWEEAVLPPSVQVNGLRLALESPLKKGPYVCALSTGQGGFYQMAVLPERLFDNEEARKILVLIDYNYFAGAAHITPEMLMGELRQQMKKHLAPYDSFNIIVSNLTPRLISNQWMAATPANLDQAFASARSQLADYSNLPPLLGAGVQFIQQHDRKGAILLATNATNYNSHTSVNPLLNDILLNMGTPRIPIHALNYHNFSSPSFNIGGVLYYGSEYLLVNLTRLTGGNFARTFGSTLTQAVESLISRTGATLLAADVHTTLANGYCYGRFTLNQSDEALYLNRPILQVGRYQGQFPLKIQIAGELNGEVSFGEIVVEAPSIGLSDTLNREMWFGNYLQLLERGTPSSNTIAEIIYQSIAERVLSRYTAFLCLEDVIYFCPTCLDETQSTSTNAPVESDSTVRAWPNPFTDRITIEARLNAGSALPASAGVEIYNTSGQLVRRLVLAPDGASRVIAVWDGKDAAGNDAPAGVYVALVRTGANQQTALRIAKNSP